MYELVNDPLLPPSRDFPALVNLGGTLNRLRRFKEALPYNQRARKRRPDDLQANVQLGTTNYFLRDYENALRYFNAARTLDPESEFIRLQLFLADTQLHRGDTAGAIPELEDYLRRDPDGPASADVRMRIVALKSGT